MLQVIHSPVQSQNDFLEQFIDFFRCQSQWWRHQQAFARHQVNNHAGSEDIGARRIADIPGNLNWCPVFAVLVQLIYRWCLFLKIGH